MAKAKKSSSPLAMMGCLGLLAVVFFGGMVSWLSDKPIVRLRPELEKHYGVKGFRCSLHLNEGRLDVETPGALLLDRWGRRRLGAEAFRRYLKLTKRQTQIMTVRVLPSGEEVTREQADRFFGVEDYLMEIARVANEAAPGATAAPQLSPAYNGVAVIMDVTCDDATAKRVASAIERVSNITFVQLRRGGSAILEKGTDARYVGDLASSVGSGAR